MDTYETALRLLLVATVLFGAAVATTAALGGQDTEYAPGDGTETPTPTPTLTETETETPPSTENDQVYPNGHECAGEQYPQDDCESVGTPTPTETETPTPTPTPTETPSLDGDQLFCDDDPDDGFDCEPGMPRRNGSA